jgi:hypothetical protein
MRESKVEGHLDRQARLRGGETRAISWRGRRGAPDRLVLLPPAGDVYRYFLVELKRPKGGALEPHQEREIELLRGFGLPVYVCHSIEDVDEILRVYDRIAREQGH